MNPLDSQGSDFGTLTSSDAKLVKSCLKGNEEAWSSLIDKYKNLIYSVPLKLGLSHDDAAEIFQAVCFDLFSELERLREPKALPMWLLRVAYHKALRLRRDRDRFLEREPAAESYEESTAEKVPDFLSREIGQEQKLRETLARLSPRCQDLIRRLFFDSPPQPYEAIAVSLGLARGSVPFIRSRCLKTLRSRLEKAGFVRE